LSFEADKSTHLEDYYIIPSIGGLRLLKLGLIFGANASGKTTVLKALDFLRDLVLKPKEQKTTPLEISPFLFDTDTRNQNTVLSIEFIQNGIRYYYEVELNKHAIAKEELYFFNPNKANVFKRTTDFGKQLSQITFGSKIKNDKIFEKILEANTLWNNTVLGGFLKTNIESKELKEVTAWFSDYLRPLISSETNLIKYTTSRIDKSILQKEAVIDILNAADFNISDLLIKKEEESLSVEHSVNNEKYFLSFADESQGTQRYYGFAGVLCLLIKDSVAFPVDELEASLHPDLFIHFLLSFLVNSKKSQIIATTHNREILNNKDIFRNDAIWITDKADSCATELYSLSDFDSSVIRDTSNIYNAYKTGKLGGIPNLGDYYIDARHETE
jgi:AAA15 family ATPase/GTPase